MASYGVIRAWTQSAGHISRGYPRFHNKKMKEYLPLSEKKERPGV